MTQKSRSELKQLFQTGAKPSQQDFADFIESTLNIKEDGIEKPSGANTPLKITAQDTDEKLLDFYAGETKTWSINQKPGNNKIGLNISNAGESRLFIDNNNGNVGLSIDQPTAKLHIQQTGNEDALRIDELKGTTPFLIDKDGNVGIGTTTPTAKLEVSGDLKVTGAITPSAGNSENNGIMFPKDPGGGSDDAAWIRYYSRNPNSTDQGTKEQTTFAIGTSNDTTDHIALMPSGNVGIGTSNPGAKLDVNGGIRIRDTEVDGNWMNIYYEKGNKTIVFYHQNNRGQYMSQDGAWRQNSDISLKQNICDLTGILNQVLQLRPVKFEWKNNRMLNIGFIAQEVEEIFPEIVSSVTIKQECEQEIKGLPYAHFGVLAIAAIKEMKTNYDQELSILQKQIKIMQEQISQTNKNG